MSILDKERQTQLEPKRMEYAKEKIQEMGYEIQCSDENRLMFLFKGNKIEFFPYSGWYSGKGIASGRGLVNLLNKIKCI